MSRSFPCNYDEAMHYLVKARAQNDELVAALRQAERFVWHQVDGAGPANALHELIVAALEKVPS